MIKSGEVLNGVYKIIKPIGEGGGGVILLAYHTNLQKEVVLKMIKDKVKGKIDVRSEVDILKNLKHTYLPQVIDFIEKDGEVYTVMDFIEGKSFSALLNENQKFTQKQVVKWTGQLCQALQYLHSQNPPIIHSDIKPGNIMLTPKDDICLIDFNISQLFDKEGTSVVGRTSGYAPIEQYQVFKTNDNIENVNNIFQNSDKTVLEGVSLDDKTELQDETDLDDRTVIDDGTVIDSSADFDKTELMKETSSFGLRNSFGGSLLLNYTAKLDERSDIYSLGATLYHILSGVKPKIATQEQIPLKQLVPNISDGLLYIIEKAMSKDPKDRFENAKDMLNAVNNIEKFDSVYKNQKRKKHILFLTFFLMFAVSVFTIYQGVLLVGTEQNTQYKNMIEQSLNYSENYDIQEAIDISDKLISDFRNNIGGYYTKSAALYTDYQYQETIDFIKEYLSSDVAINNQETILQSNILYILGNSYLKLEDYSNAEKYFKQALEMNGENPDFYRDYAIACVRNNDIDTAYTALNNAEQMGIDSYSLMIVETEIAFVNNDFETVYSNSDEILNSDAQAFIKERAALIAKDCALKSSDFNKAVQILTKAKQSIPKNNSLIITEQLGYVYSLYAEQENTEENTKNAIMCFEELLQMGYSRFYIMQNIAILYQNIGEYSQAENMIKQMEELYPNDYRVYMQKVFLLIDSQSEITVENRNYSAVNQNYSKALELYQQSKEYGNDSQMLILDSLVQELKDKGWL